MHPEFLLTKVSVPQAAADLVIRRRLLDFLHKSADRKATIIEGGPGVGKTTLLAQYAAEVESPLCWYRTDDLDRDIVSFVQGLVVALQVRYPGFGRLSSQRLLTSIGGAEETRDLVAAFIADVKDQISASTILVIDDLHEVLDSRSHMVFLESLIRYLPRGLHLLLASRHHPPFPWLIRAIANGEVAMLSGTELHFTSEEVRLYYLLTHGTALPDNEMERVWRLTNGWPALLALQPWLAQQTPVGAGGLLVEYLATEVLEGARPEIRYLLIHTSFLKELKPELCDYVLSRNNSASILLESVNSIPLVSRTAENGYVVHDLLRHFLSDRLEQDPAARTMLLKRAAEWFDRAGLWAQAFGYWLSAGLDDAAAEAASARLDRLVSSGAWTAILSTAGQLTTPTLTRHPELMLAVARASGETGDAEKHLELATAAEAVFEGMEGALGRQRARLFQVMAERLLGETRPALDKALATLSELEKLSASPADIAQAHYQIGMCLGQLGIFKQANAHLAAALAYFKSVGDIPNSAACDHYLGVVLEELGDVQGAARHMDAAIRGWEKVGNRSRLASCLNSRATLCHQVGDFALALDLLERGLAISDELLLGRIKAYVHCTMGDVLRDSGQTKQALTSYKQGMQTAQQLGDTHLVCALQGRQALALCLDGELEGATRLVEGALSEARHLKDRRLEASFLRTRGIIRYRCGDLDGTEQDLIEASAAWRRLGSASGQTETQLVLAAVHLAQGHADLARNELLTIQSAVAEAKHLGHLVRAGRAVPEALEFASREHSLSPIFTAALYRVRQQPAGSGSGHERTGPEKRPARLVAYGLGKAEVYEGGRLIPRGQWRSQKVKELLFFLASTGGRATKEQIGEALWPEAKESQLDNNLRVTLSRLRKALQPDIIWRDGDTIGLRESLFDYDVTRFQDLLTKAKRLPSSSPVKFTLLQEAFETYQGPFAEEFYSDWAETIRRTLVGQFVACALGAGEGFAAQGDYERAISALERAIKLDPLNEEARALQMEYWVRSLRNAEAARAYEAYEQLVQKELGCAPGPALRALYQSIKGPRTQGSLR